MTENVIQNTDDDDKEGGNSSMPTVTSRIGFGSCHKSIKSSMPPIWDTILPSDSPEPLDAWLWLGDAIYPSHRDPITRKKYYGPAPPQEIDASLRSLKHENATIGYKGFLERLTSMNTNKPFVVTGIWDDHDFGGNDMGHKMPFKEERRAIYEDFLGHPSTSEARKPWGKSKKTKESANDDSNEGMYHRVDLEGGKIRLLVLDTRYFREDHCIPSVAHRIPMGNGVACMTRWLTSVRSMQLIAK